MFGIVRRKGIRNFEFGEVEQVADRVLVFFAIQATNRCTAGLGVLGEFAFEPLDHLFSFFVRWLVRVGWRHLFVGDGVVNSFPKVD